MLPRKLLLCRRSVPFCFAVPTRFWVPECHRNRVESSTTEKVFFFFSFPVRLLREGKEFTIAEGTRVQSVKVQGLVVQRLDNAIHRINRYPADKC